MSLDEVCAQFLGVRVNLNTRALVTIRPWPVERGLSNGVKERQADQRFRSFRHRDGLSGAWLRNVRPRIKDYTNWNEHISAKRGDVEEALFERWKEARNNYGEGRLQEATEIAIAIKSSLRETSRSFAERLAIHCDALLVDTVDTSSLESLRHAAVAARSNTARYLAQRDNFSAGISLLSEAQLNRTSAILDPECRDALLRRALTLARAANAALGRRYPEHDAKLVAFVRREAIFNRARLLQESGALDEGAMELQRLRESALQLDGGLGLLEYARAEASLSLSLGNLDRSAQAIANGSWLYENIRPRPGITMLSFLGRMLDWCRLANKRVNLDELEGIGGPRTLDPPDEYTARWQTRIRSDYGNCDDVRWELASAPAAYVARISSLYLEPKLSRL